MSEAQVVTRFPWIGAVFRVEFLAKIRDSSRFASADALAAVAGIAPVLGLWFNLTKKLRQ